MVLLADPALDNSSLAGRQSVQGGGVLLFLVLLLVRHKLHPNLLRHNGCLEKVIISIREQNASIEFAPAD